MLSAAIVAYIATGRWTAVLGSLLVVIGDYLGTQANHLAQENHKGERMSWIEIQQQRHQAFFQNLGLMIFVLGFWIIF